MAYHLGRILQLDFGYQAIAVQVHGETADHGIHRYDPQFSSITVAEMESTIHDDDVLICNPSFSSFQFGLRLPGRKLSYVQHFNTFAVLDRGFDHYVAVSDVVRRFLGAIYGLTPPIISPFINLDGFPAPISWWSRPAGSTLVFVKGEASTTGAIMSQLRSIMSRRAPDIALDIVGGPLLPQNDLMKRIGGYRHLLALSPAEGFGLVPLEAMAMGTTVLGFDGFGGRDYMRTGVNCAVAAYPDIEAVADNLITMTRSPELAAKLAAAGRATAEQYGYEKFRAAWTEEFSRFLSVKPGPVASRDGVDAGAADHRRGDLR